MKIKNGFKLREVDGVNIVVPLGEKGAQFKGLIRLNPTGAFLWKIIDKGTTEEELVEAMLDKYDVDRETATEDIAQFVKMIREANLIDE